MPNEEEEIINLISQELQSGKSMDAVAAELVQAGLPQDEAATVVRAVAQQMAGKGGGRAPAGRAPASGGGGRAPMPRGPPPRRSQMPYIIMIIAILILLYLAYFRR